MAVPRRECYFVAKNSYGQVISQVGYRSSDLDKTEIATDDVRLALRWMRPTGIAPPSEGRQLPIRAIANPMYPIYSISGIVVRVGNKDFAL